MNFDRNTIFGFIALAVLFLAYFFYNSKGQQEMLAEKARQDSIAKANQPKPDTIAKKHDSALIDSQNRVTSAGDYGQYIKGTEQLTQITTDVVTIAFTNKGGQPKWVELKNFKGPDNKNVRMAATDFDKISYSVKTGNNQTADITNFYFAGGQVVKNADNTQTITYQLQSPTGSKVEHQYIVRAGNYMIDFNLLLNGADQLVSGNTINLTWQNKAVQLQKDLSYERQESRVAYRVDADYDYSSATGTDYEELDKNVNWVAVKQQFFNSAIVAKNNFSSGRVEWVSPTTGNTIVQTTANLKLNIPSSSANIPLSLYYGPTDYKILKQYNNEMEDMVNLGSGMFAFVKYLNRWIVLPVFDMFRKLTSNYGIVILLLTLVIRLLISPLTYKSYLSGAKMIS
jgi:YidC/Oxa1 family membrane protein insertase